MHIGAYISELNRLKRAIAASRDATHVLIMFVQIATADQLFNDLLDIQDALGVQFLIIWIEGVRANFNVIRDNVDRSRLLNGTIGTIWNVPRLDDTLKNASIDENFLIIGEDCPDLSCWCAKAFCLAQIAHIMTKTSPGSRPGSWRTISALCAKDIARITMEKSTRSAVRRSAI